MSEPAPRPNLRTLTGLRFVAALLVFGRHVEWFFVGSRSDSLVQHVVRAGPSGVSFFFVLSGFVLMWSRRPHDTARAFYRRRFARIYPDYLVAWVIGGLVCLWVGIKVSVPIAAAALVSVQAFVPHQSYFLGMDGVSWSVSCEVFFYLLFPVWVSLLIRAPRPVRLLALTVCLGGTIAMPWITPALFPHDNPLWFLYILPPVRLLEFTAGLVLALEVMDGTWPRLRGVFVVPVVVIAYLAASDVGLARFGSIPTTASYAACTIVPFVLLIGVAAYADLEGRWTPLRQRWAVRLGERSYAFYLLHFPVVLAFGVLTGHRYLGSVRALVASVAVLAVAVACSAALYHFVERPFERRLRRAPDRPSALVVAD